MGLATSDDPFDQWFRELIKEVHGIDMSESGPPPELVLDASSERRAAALLIAQASSAAARALEDEQQQDDDGDDERDERDGPGVHETLPSFPGRSLAAPNGRLIIPSYPDTTDER